MAETASPRRYSYTALDTFVNCPMSYYLKYRARKRPEERSIALSFGNICHKVRELCSHALMAGETPDYGQLENTLLHGWRGVSKADGTTEESIDGVLDIQNEFASDWYAVEDGIPSYDERLAAVIAHLPDDERQTEWKPLAAEISFEIPYEDVLLFGVIDKVEVSPQGELRIVDYKTSKRVFSDKQLTTPLQMYIYYLAAQQLFPDQPVVQCLYDFIALGEQREGGTCGWLKRADSKLHKILESLRRCDLTDEWKPNPTPLCYWCGYNRTNPKADVAFFTECDWYSLWKPTEKSFRTAKPWEPGTTMAAIATKKAGEFWF